jgi:hypothetical protein
VFCFLFFLFIYLFIYFVMPLTNCDLFPHKLCNVIVIPCNHAKLDFSQDYTWMSRECQCVCSKYLLGHHDLTYHNEVYVTMHFRVLVPFLWFCLTNPLCVRMATGQDWVSHFPVSPTVSLGLS